MALVSNDPCLECKTDTYAYPINANYRPIVRVFEAPYKSGDCPIFEQMFSFHVFEDAGGTQIEEWYFMDTDFNCWVGEKEVFIRDYKDETFDENKNYEIRIYQSNEPTVS